MAVVVSSAHLRLFSLSLFLFLSGRKYINYYQFAPEGLLNYWSVATLFAFNRCSDRRSPAASFSSIHLCPNLSAVCCSPSQCPASISIMVSIGWLQFSFSSFSQWVIFSLCAQELQDSLLWSLAYDPRWSDWVSSSDLSLFSYPIAWVLGLLRIFLCSWILLILFLLYGRWYRISMNCSLSFWWTK